MDKKSRNIRIGYILDHHCKWCIEDCEMCPIRRELDVLANVKKEKPGVPFEWAKFKIELDKWIMQGCSLRMIANRLQTPESTIRRRVRKYTNISIGEYIRKLNPERVNMYGSSNSIEK